MTTKKAVVIVSAAFLAVGTAVVSFALGQGDEGDSEAWREACVSIERNEDESSDLGVETAYNCTKTNGSVSLVYTFADDAIRDSTRATAESFGVRVLDQGSGWLEVPAADFEEDDTEPTPAAEAEATPDTILSFGETFQGNHGTITVSEPKPYTPSEYASHSAKAKRFVVIRITVENSSSEVIDDYSWITEAQFNGRRIDPVFDDGLDEPPAILPGQTGTWKVAYGIPGDNSQPFTFELSYGLADPIYWSGSA